MQPSSGRHIILREAGFTLVELMVVLTILGLLTTAAVLTIPSSAGGLEEDAQRFAARTAALRDNAILQSRPMAVQVTRSGYSFLERRNGSWNPMEDGPFASTGWSSGVTATLDEADQILISFESTGLPSDQTNIILNYEDVSRTIFVAAMGDVSLGGPGE